MDKKVSLAPIILAEVQVAINLDKYFNSCPKEEGVFSGSPKNNKVYIPYLIVSDSNIGLYSN